MPLGPGEIVHLDGRVLGRHPGIVHFTVGQRRGLNLSAPDPLYVVSIDAGRARVVVGPREALATTRVSLRDVNWIGDGGLSDIGPDGLAVAVRVRSTRAPRDARLRVLGPHLEIELATPEEGVSPGQACVLYDGIDARARVLGGGTITKSVVSGLAAAA